MASVSGTSGKRLVDELIANNGAYCDDPPVIAIFQYQTPEGATDCWILCYSVQEIQNALTSPFVVDPKQVFGKPVVGHRPNL